MNTQRISVKRAAELLGVSQEFIRCGMICKELPIGTALKLRGKKYTYHICPRKLAKYLEMNEEQLKGVMDD